MGFSIRSIVAASFVALAVVAPSSTVAQGHPQPCVQRTFEEARFTVCAFDSEKDELKLVVRDASGKAYRRLPKLAEAMGDRALDVSFAMNAGMFDAMGAPIGLYVENGKTLKALNQRNGFGNFHLNPNGVFWSSNDGGLHVSTTDDYAAEKPRAKWATQSGPMLVIGGKLHPAFSPDGDSRYIRNGVGVTSEHTAVFVISDDEVSFGKFARFFRDELKTDNALYFDGAVSSLWAPSLGRMDSTRNLGPIVVVTSP